MKKEQVDIFLITDKALRSRIGRYKYILVCRGHTREGNGQAIDSTGNRLALECAIKALGRMKRPSVITIHTDSRYLINGSRFLKTWEKAGWTRTGGRELKNADLWEELDKKSAGHAIRFQLEDMSLYS